MKKKIKLYIKDKLKSYKVYKNDRFYELYNSCIDEYELQINNGLNDKDAFELAVQDVEGIISSYLNKGENKYSFSILICFVALFVSILEMLFTFSVNTLNIYGLEMLIFIVILLIFFGYSIVTKKNRRWYEYLIIIIFFVTWVITYLQIGKYYFRGTMPNIYYTADFIFPCIINIQVWYRESANLLFDISANLYLIDLNFIISILMTILMTILNMKQKK